MAKNIQSLWSSAIKSTVLSPLTILRGQADALALQTGGVLVAEVVEEHDAGERSLSFDLVAPALNGSRHRILKIRQGVDREYPVTVEAEVFRFVTAKRAHTDEEFTALVAEVLKSGNVTSIAQSLIARVNEVLATKTSS